MSEENEKPESDKESLPASLFISYSNADRLLANWIALTFEEAWGFRPGENFALKMQQAIRGVDRAAQPSETSSGLTELDKRMADDLIRTIMVERFGWNLAQGIEGGPGSLDASSSGQPSGEGGNVDATGSPIETVRVQPLHGFFDVIGEKLFIMTIPVRELEQLNAKTAELLREAELAYVRITKDQEEAERLKMETRAMLEGLRAA